MSSPWILTSPASRGIGWAITRNLLQTTKAPILSTTRASDTSSTKKALLEGLDNVDDKRLTVVELDVKDEKSIKEASEHAKSLFPTSSHHLHLAFAIPGILLPPEKNPSAIDYDNALETFKVNTIGPMLLFKHFSSFLPNNSKQSNFGEGDQYEGLNVEKAVWAMMSARVGSVSDNKKGGWYSYRSSKAAINQLVKSFHLHSTSSTTMVLGLHPGTVKTDLSKDYWSKGMLEKEESAEKLVDLVRKAGESYGGKIWDYKNDEILP